MITPHFAVLSEQMEQKAFWETDSRSASSTSLNLWNQNVCSLAQNKSPMLLILIHINSTHIFPNLFL